MTRKTWRDTLDGRRNGHLTDGPTEDRGLGNSLEWLRAQPLGVALRKAFEADLNAPLPDRLADLVKQIREAEARRNEDLT